jgi:hypothetical protein
MNQAASGGALSLYRCSASLAAVNASQNLADVGGFGFFGSKSVATIANSSFVNQLACSGGVVFAETADSVSITGSSLHSNVARHCGGSLLLVSSELSATDSRFDANNATAGSFCLFFPLIFSRRLLTLCFVFLLFFFYQFSQAVSGFGFLVPSRLLSLRLLTATTPSTVKPLPRLSQVLTSPTEISFSLPSNIWIRK